MRHFFLLLGFLSAFAASPAQQCSFVLTGHIEDADTKEKLSGATILISAINLRFVTNAEGDFRYSNICQGTYSLEVSHPGCETIAMTVNVTRNMHLDVLLPHLRNNLQEVVVEAAKPIPNTGYRQQLDGRALESARNLSLAEALSRINGVNVLQTGSTVSKPVVHGLHSNRVLIINNGIRQEGQQWGNEHAPEIDLYLAGKLTVIKGVDELRYGSDAIGGVVLVDPRPVRAIPGYNAEINTAYAFNNGQYVVSGIFEHQLKRIAALSYRLQGTFKKSANVQTPGYRLNNTALEEKNFSLTANWKKEHYQVQAYFSQFATGIGIFEGSHIGNLSDLQQAIASDRPDEVFLNEKSYGIGRPRQQVLHRLFKVRSVYEKGQHRINLQVSGQYNRRREYDIVRSSSITGPQLGLSIITLAEELSYEHPQWRGIKGVAGISLMQQDNTTSGRYLIPRYQANTYGAYWIEKWGLNKWNVEAGLRYDHKTVSTGRSAYGGVLLTNDFRFPTFGASVNTGYRLNESLKVNATASLSSRAPQVNELLIDGIHHGTATYETGNVNLETERSVNIAAGLVYSNSKRFSAEVHIYHNRISDFIYQQPRPDQPVLTVRGAFPKWEYQQTDATLSGMDLSAVFFLHQQLQLSSKASVLRARNQTAGDWLILMPADRWSNQLTCQFKAGSRISDAYASAELMWVFAPRVPSDRNGKQDYKPPPGEYALLHLDAGASVRLMGTPLNVGLTVRNALDKRYRDYLNAFRYFTDEMGRNVVLRLRIPLENFLNKPK